MPARVAVLAIVSVLALAGCSGDDGDQPSARDTGPTTGTHCSYQPDGRAPAKEVSPPPATATLTGHVPATVKTSVGELDVDLDADSAPCTVSSFVSLAKQGYFDDTTCHRLTTAGIFVLQCGDPTGTGTGGPGYTIPDELSGKETYPAGTLAMANTGQPDTGGSQFFVVYDDTPLPPSYTVFGHLDPASVKVVEKVAAKGTTTGGPDGPPKEQVKIESVTVDE